MAAMPEMAIATVVTQPNTLVVLPAAQCPITFLLLANRTIKNKMIGATKPFMTAA